MRAVADLDISDDAGNVVILYHLPSDPAFTLASLMFVDCNTLIALVLSDTCDDRLCTVATSAFVSSPALSAALVVKSLSLISWLVLVGSPRSPFSPCTDIVWLSISSSGMSKINSGSVFWLITRLIATSLLRYIPCYIKTTLKRRINVVADLDLQIVIIF